MTFQSGCIGSFQKTSTTPPRRNLEVTPHPLDVLKHYYQKQIVLPYPSRQQKFHLWGESVDLVWNDPFKSLTKTLKPENCTIKIKVVIPCSIIELHSIIFI